MVEAEVGAGLGKLTAATGAPPSREETRELVRESVFRWSPLLARFRPTFRRRIDEAADEILDFWTLWLDDEEMRPPRFEPAPP